MESVKLQTNPSKDSSRAAFIKSLAQKHRMAAKTQIVEGEVLELREHDDANSVSLYSAAVTAKTNAFSNKLRLSPKKVLPEGKVNNQNADIEKIKESAFFPKSPPPLPAGKKSNEEVNLSPTYGGPNLDNPDDDEDDEVCGEDFHEKIENSAKYTNCSSTIQKIELNNSLAKFSDDE